MKIAVEEYLRSRSNSVNQNFFYQHIYSIKKMRKIKADAAIARIRTFFTRQYQYSYCPRRGKTA